MNKRILRKELAFVILLLFSEICLAQNLQMNESKEKDLLRSNIEQMDSQEKVFLSPPPSFDLRNVNGTNYTTSIKDQQGGTCWCFSTMASMESNLLITDKWKSSGEYGLPDLSEYHMDWWNGFNNYNNDDDPHGNGLNVHYGGDFLIASAYLSRGEGAIREIDTPGDAFNSTPHRSYPSYHYYYPKNIEWLTAGPHLENLSIIKEVIMTKGAIATYHCSAEDYKYNGGTYWAFYQPPGSNFSNQHNVVIIGWDDNKITSAPLSGAWLIKDSRGDFGPEHGYYWISFYDYNCCQHPYQGAVSFQDVELLKYNSIYYHDYHGWRSTIRSVEKAFNKFVATTNETLKAISFFAAQDDITFDAIIYDSFENGSLKKALSSFSGSINYKGFHTIELATPIPLQKGSDFYIYLYLSEGGQPIDRTSFASPIGDRNRVIVTSIANPRESYYLNGSTWYDLYNYSFIDPTWNHTANFCMKALCSTNDSQPYLYVTPRSINIEDIKPGSTVTFIIQISNFGAKNSILNWNIAKSANWGSWTFMPSQGSLPYNSTINVTVTVVVPTIKNKPFLGSVVVKDIDHLVYQYVNINLKTPLNTQLLLKNNFLENFLNLRINFKIVQENRSITRLNS